mgnify:CR=1 FL=1
MTRPLRLALDSISSIPPLLALPHISLPLSLSLYHPCPLSFPQSVRSLSSLRETQVTVDKDPKQAILGSQEFFGLVICVHVVLVQIDTLSTEERNEVIFPMS